MKKLIAILLSAAAIGVVSATAAPVEAQVIMVNRCCDNGGYARCNINWTPVGNACFCYGQGWGYACY